MKKVKGIRLANRASLALVSIFGIGTGLNLYFNHNVKEETESRIILKKANLFGYTTIIIGKEDPVVLLSQYQIFNHKIYIDEDGDKKVDEFSEHYTPIRRKRDLKLRRDNKKQYEFYKGEFERADNEFSEQLKRFNIENK